MLPINEEKVSMKHISIFSLLPMDHYLTEANLETRMKFSGIKYISKQSCFDTAVLFCTYIAWVQSCFSYCFKLFCVASEQQVDRLSLYLGTSLLV